MVQWIIRQAIHYRIARLCGCLVLATFCAGIGPFGSACVDEDVKAAAAGELPAPEEFWEVLYVGNSRVGYSRSSVTRKKVAGKEIVATDTEVNLVFARLGQSVKTKTIAQTEETPEGDLLEFRYEMQNPPHAPTRRSGRVEGTTLILKTETNGKTRAAELPWDDSYKSPDYQHRWLREAPLEAGEKRVLKSFDPQFGVLQTVTIQAMGVKEAALLDRRKKKLLEVKVLTSIVPNLVTLEYHDDRGRPLKSTENLLQMTSYHVTKDEALKALTGEEVDLALRTLVNTKPIKDAGKTRQVIYRIAIPGEDPGKILSTGPTQKIARVDPTTVDLTVDAITPPEEGSPQVDDGPGKEFVVPNGYLQSDDELVRKHAAAAVADEEDPWKAAQLMERWVAQNLKLKNFTTLLASAAEVAKNLSGDCTEHAVLLAAMCRARKIPSRVVVGLLYISKPPSFGGHMWTEVYIRGQWIPLDATLGQGGIAADHIKFSDSSFSDEGGTTAMATFLPMVSVLSGMKIDAREVKYDE
jgi:hypothetical protein